MKNLFLMAFSMALAFALTACGNIVDKTSGQLEARPDTTPTSTTTANQNQNLTNPVANSPSLASCSTTNNIQVASPYFNNAQAFKACGASNNATNAVSLYASQQSQNVCVFPVLMGANGPTVYTTNNTSSPTQQFVYSCGTVSTQGAVVSFNNVPNFNAVYVVDQSFINRFTACLAYGQLQTCLNQGVNFSYGQFR